MKDVPLTRKQQRAREYYKENRDKVIARAKLQYKEQTEQRKKYASDLRLSRKLEFMALLGGECNNSDCHQSHPAAIDFHHVDPSQKMYSITDLIVRPKKHSSKEIIEEVMKCVLLCKNCHAIEHCKWYKDAYDCNPE